MERDGDKCLKQNGEREKKDLNNKEKT